MSLSDRLAVVIPTLDEADRLPVLLESLEPLDASVVVSDGGSHDETRTIAEEGGAAVVLGDPSRSAQLRRGAAATTADWLFFLHADCVLEPKAIESLRAFLDEAGEQEFAHFSFRLAEDHAFYRFIELGQRLRERLTGLAYGDQGLVVSRKLYERVGGYPEWPILEDVGILERLRRVGSRRALAAPLPTSARRYRAEGHWRGWLRNAAIMTLYRLGVSAERIAERFPRTRPPDDVFVNRTIVVFAKAPREGYVKTRLAADIGDREAARIYRALGRKTVDAFMRMEERLVVYYDPPDPTARAEVETWLGSAGVEFRPQRGTDLGERMANAFEECLREAHEVCIVGTDVPDMGAETVEEAFRRLAETDVVIGPATDGGYYLLALSDPHPELFDGIEWSTPSVLEETLARAGQSDLSVDVMTAKTDVDTLSDVPPELLSARARAR